MWRGGVGGREFVPEPVKVWTGGNRGKPCVVDARKESRTEDGAIQDFVGGTIISSIIISSIDGIALGDLDGFLLGFPVGTSVGILAGKSGDRPASTTTEGEI